MNKIHHTAIIHESAVLGSNNEIGPYCIIGPGVILGDNNRIDSHAVIGSNAEHKDFFHRPGTVKIGNSNIIREFTTINASTGPKPTLILNSCILLRGSHVGHDSVIEDKVTVSCNAIIGGHSYIMQGANLALGCVIHQRQVIGSFAMIGMAGVVTKKAEIEPGKIYAGNPAKFLSVNLIGLQRNNVDGSFLVKETERFHATRAAIL